MSHQCVSFLRQKGLYPFTTLHMDICPNPSTIDRKRLLHMIRKITKVIDTKAKSDYCSIASGLNGEPRRAYY